MRIDLSGKKAIVSGSTAGIGFGIARGLALAGADVVITGRTQERVDQAIDALKQDTKSDGIAALDHPDLGQLYLANHARTGSDGIDV